MTADLVEGHTIESPYTKSSCIANLDGQDLSAVDLLEYIDKFKQCDLIFLWSYLMNGVEDPNHFVDPRLRSRFW